MDPAVLKMIDSLEKKTGKKLEYFTQLVNEKNFSKHGESVEYLKSEHGLGHGYANMVVHLAKENSSIHLEGDDMLESQYKGKEHFKPLYEQLIGFAKSLGKDVELAPKKAYMSLRRNKQFAILQPATKSRFEVQLNLKGYDSEGILEKINTPNSMCSHKISLTEGPASEEVMGWLKKAYEQA